MISTFFVIPEIGSHNPLGLQQGITPTTPWICCSILQTELQVGTVVAKSIVMSQELHFSLLLLGSKNLCLLKTDPILFDQIYVSPPNIPLLIHFFLIWSIANDIVFLF